MTSILTVCTGNICRSPVAELLLREYLGDTVTIASAGTHAMVGHGIPDELLVSLDADGIDGRSHRAQTLTETLARDADLIVAMAAEHRARIVRQTPSALRRIFLLDELAKAARAGVALDGATASARLASVPAAIERFRPELATSVVADIPDPYGRSRDDYDRSYAMIRNAVRDIAGWVENAQ